MPDFKPFGGHNYGGYDKTSDTVISWSVWAAATYGSFSIDPLEAAAVLGTALYIQEHPKLWQDDDDEKHMGNCASAVHNMQAGYCMYHVFYKGRNHFDNKRDVMPALAAHMELISNLYATWVEDEKATPPVLYAHDAHYKGMFLGMAAAFLLDCVRPHKRGGKNTLWDMALPPLSGLVLYLTQYAKEKRRMTLPSMAEL